MRRRTSLSVWLILGLVASLGIAPSMSAKQGQEPHEDLESSFSIDIEMTCGGAPCDVTEQFQAYDITFLPAAYIPERTYTGAMIVKVQEGTFAFRVQSNDVLVDPQGSEIQLLEANPPVPLGTPPKDVMPAFNPNGTIPISDCLG